MIDTSSSSTLTEETQEDYFTSSDHEASPLLLGSLIYKMEGSSSASIGEVAQDKAILGKSVSPNSPFTDKKDLAPILPAEISMFSIGVMRRYLSAATISNGKRLKVRIIPYSSSLLT